MIEIIYQLLAKVGFTHPLHPAITHIPMGMIMGAFFFRMAFMILQKDDLAKAAHYCITLALIFVLPTMVLGYMDWQYKLNAEWSHLILIKIVLGFLLFALLTIAFVLGQNETRRNNIIVFLFYVLCLLNAIGLGYTGGEIQYG